MDKDDKQNGDNIYQHLNPIVDRLGRVEGLVGRHDKDLEDVGKKVDRLEDKISNNHDTVISCIKDGQQTILARVQGQESKIEMNMKATAKISGWLKGVVIGGITVVGLLKILSLFGVF